MDMAKRSSKRSSKATGRPKPVTSKAGVSRDGKRRYSCGGRLRK